ncbi:MAG: serpin family protein [Gemmatimonadota bacterium]
MTRRRSADPPGLPAVLALVFALVVAAGCGDTSGPGEGPEPITELPRALSPTESRLVALSNAFGLELLREVVTGEEGPNVVLSPFSASVALGMALNGADGETFDAMRQTLGHADLEQDAVNTAYRDLLSLLVDLDPAVEFRVANSLWADEGFPFEEDFVTRVGTHFDAVARTLDLQAPATLEAINGWVEGETNGRISTLLEEVDPLTVMFLINAIYFESDWTLRFNPGETRTAPFRRADGQEVPVPLMEMRNVRMPWAWERDFVAVDLPYGGEAFGMLVILPHEGISARELAAELSAADLAELEASLNETDVDRLALPRFKLSYGKVLDDALEAMGMGVAFDRLAADFSRMSSEERLFIDEVWQKTFIEVDEAGTRAAAATSVDVEAVSPPTLLVADRPFLFLLRERLSGTILFAGLVGDPTVES